jgi:8-oxo-dGTP pyrophosphatase MutT (NUDIX family)
MKTHVTQSSASDIEIAALDATEIQLEPWFWPFAAERREEIAAHFADLQRVRSGIWNGRILLVKNFAVEAGVLRGACFETDFAGFCAWRDWGFPDASVHNVFSAAALRSADGAFLLGEMAPSTANAGRIYFPCGTPEPADVDAAGLLDLAGSISRELLEETGLAIGELTSVPGWTMVRDRCYLALLRQVTSPLGAAELRARIVDHLAREQRPEFVDIHIVRSSADFAPAMPRFVKAYLTHLWP